MLNYYLFQNILKGMFCNCNRMIMINSGRRSDPHHAYSIRNLIRNVYVSFNGRRRIVLMMFYARGSENNADVYGLHLLGFECSAVLSSFKQSVTQASAGGNPFSS